MTNAQALPKIVSQQEWDAARAAFLRNKSKPSG